MTSDRSTTDAAAAAPSGGPPRRPRDPRKPFVIEWYRPSLWGRLMFSWGLISGALIVGLVGVALAWNPTLSASMPDGWRWAAGAVGTVALLFVAVGRRMGVGRVIGRGALFLLVRSDGLVLSDGKDGGQLVPWRSLGTLRLDGDTLVLEREDGAPLRMRARFSGVTAEVLLARLQAHRRDALLGVVRRSGLTIP